ncbi:MAG: helix-turn-helix transcriptional regulator [Rhodospirillaceae bacterium]|nr:helix-turn-helix transcriptional regulator [Rhodospirillaceae bacterium]
MKTDPHPVDQIVGANLRRLRLKANMSQTELGHRVGVSFQQIQKYENATDRIAASRLWGCAQALGVEVGTFFAPPQD